MSDYYRIVGPIDGWKKLTDFFWKDEDDWRYWIFRGQRSNSWGLTTRLEREVTRFGNTLDRFADFESWLFREFRRHYHRYATPPPDIEVLEWLALMAHHGAPTRLMDWTHSFWVGLFFALSGASVGETSSLWALDRRWLVKHMRDKISDFLPSLDTEHDKDPFLLAKFMSEYPAPLVVPGTPMRLSDRLSGQQGNFLFPRDATVSFEDNVRATAPSAECPDHILRIDVTCSDSLLSAAWMALHDMNITHLTLFPGLDGLARSLSDRIAVPLFYRYAKSVGIWELSTADS